MRQPDVFKPTILVVVVLSCLVPATGAQAQTREWTGTTGSWFEPSN